MSYFRFLLIMQISQYQSIDYYWFILIILIEIKDWFSLIGIVWYKSTKLAPVMMKSETDWILKFHFSNNARSSKYFPYWVTLKFNLTSFQEDTEIIKRLTIAQDPEVVCKIKDTLQELKTSTNDYEIRKWLNIMVLFSKRCTKL